MDERRTATALLVTTIVIWGYNWIPMKIALGGAGPFTMTVLRLGGGVVTLLVVLLLTGRSLAPPRDRTYLWLGLTQVAGMVGLSSVALSLSDAGRTAILLFTMPLWTVLLARLVLGERIGAARWAGLGLVAAGIATIVVGGRLDGVALIAAACSIAGGFCWALGVVIAKRAGPPTDLLRLTAWQQIVGTIPSLGVMLLVHEHPVVWSTPVVVAIAFNGVVGSGLAWLTWSGAVARLPAAVVSISSLAIPVIAQVAAALQLGERPDGRELVGDALMLGGLALALAFGARRGPLPSAPGRAAAPPSPATRAVPAPPR